MSTHKIQWLNMPGYVGRTLSPTIGCSKISQGCKNCYAERMAKRLSGNPKTPQYKEVADTNGWNGKTMFLPARLKQIDGWKKPSFVFIPSMGDIFHEDLSFNDIKHILDELKKHPKHIFLILTKRPHNAALFFANHKSECENSIKYPHIWIGASIENQQTAKTRLPYLFQLPFAKHVVSYEPSVGGIDISMWINAVDWVICGGESGPGARPMHYSWVKSVMDQCQTAKTPFFFKQWGEYQPGSHYPGKCNFVVLKNGEYASWDNEDWKKMANKCNSEKEWTSLRPIVMSKVGKKQAGKEINGKTYQEYPKINSQKTNINNEKHH